MQVESIQESNSLSLIDGEESHGREDEYSSKSKEPMIQYQRYIHVEFLIGQGSPRENQNLNGSDVLET